MPLAPVAVRKPSHHAGNKKAQPDQCDCLSQVLVGQMYSHPASSCCVRARQSAKLATANFRERRVSHDTDQDLPHDRTWAALEFGVRSPTASGLLSGE